jgi:steroid delta-isomerase-like uncharacterized protein
MLYSIRISVISGGGVTPDQNPDYNKTIVRRLYEEVWNQLRFDVLEEITSPDEVNHPYPGYVPIGGPEAGKQFIMDYHASFPDLKITINNLLAEADKVAVHYTVRGTHQGAFLGIPATGKQVAVDGMGFFRIANGRIVETWFQWDRMGVLQQLGLAPVM